MTFKSLKQAYWLYKNKIETFKNIAGKYGVPVGWHEYKKKQEDWKNTLRREEE